MGGSRAGSVLVALSAAALCAVGAHPAAAIGAAPALHTGPAITSAGPATPGEELWVKRFNSGNGDDASHAVAVSPDGSTVFVTGSGGGPTSTDYVTVAYDASTGAKRWVSSYNGPGDDVDFSNAVGVSPDGVTVFVTGASPGSTSDFDYATVAYSASTGTELWVRRYNGPGNGDDETSALGVSHDGTTVYVTGGSTGSTSDHDYATVAYRASTGKQLWVKRYNGPGNGFDVAYAMSVTSDGSTVFVTGTSQGSADISDYATVAYSASGTRLWVKRYNGPANDEDSATAVAVSPDGSTVFVTGYSTGSTSDNDYATLAYTASTGTRLWVKRYNGHGNFWDFARALAVSPDGSTVFVTGQSYRSFTNPNPDYATVAYNASTGAKLWVRRYNGPGNAFDDSRTVGVSPDGSTVLVTGASPGSTGNYDFATVAYAASTGTQLWVSRYNGPGNAFDAAEALGVSPDGSKVFVTGDSYGSTSYDYATVAYSLT